MKMKTKTKMKATTKKNLLGISLIVTATALLITGIFAIFSDSATADTNGKVGTVDIGVDFEINGDVLANINPGDHDYELAEYLGTPDDWDDITDGTPHPLGLTITNDGNKSVKVRNVIDLIVTLADPDLPKKDEFLFFLTTEVDREADEAETAELVPDYYLFSDGGTGLHATKWFTTTDGVTTDGYYTVDADGDPVTIVATNLESCIGARYLSTITILSGIGEGAEIDGGTLTDIDYEYYLGLKAQADNRYQGAEIDITCIVEAIQHRNTSDDSWTIISSATGTGKVPAKDEAADGTVLTTTTTP